VWIKNGRPSILTEEFEEGNGFDLYIDGARFLPDSVTISKVSNGWSIRDPPGGGKACKPVAGR